MVKKWESIICLLKIYLMLIIFKLIQAQLYANIYARTKNRPKYPLHHRYGRRRIGGRALGRMPRPEMELRTEGGRRTLPDRARKIAPPIRASAKIASITVGQIGALAAPASIADRASGPPI